MKFIINKHKIMYTGNGKLFFEMTKIIEQSNISKENAKLILSEYEKMSLINQHIKNTMDTLICEFEKIKTILTY